MCIAILNSNGKLSKKTIKNCWDSNGDGAGLAYAENGKVKIFKEMRSVNKFYDFYNRLRDVNDGNIILHFRIATHGKIDETNCHPFVVNDKMAFIHNGIISQTSVAKSAYSDTYHFNESIVKKLPKGFLRNMAIHEMIADYIGHSKLVFLEGDGEAFIINEHFGIWDGENWYSNSSYKDKTYDSNPLTSKYYKGTSSKCKTTVYGGGWDTSAWHEEDDDNAYYSANESQCEFCGSYNDVKTYKDIGGKLCIACKNELSYYDTF